MTAWLDVVGIGADGWDGLAPASRAVLEAAEVVIGGDRHHACAPHLTAERIHWPSPFRAMVEEIRGLRGRRVAVLVTGDPLWYSAGARFAAMFAPGEVTFHPHLSAFQLACARMRWSLADVETLTVHGRPAEAVLPFLADRARLVILARDGRTPAELAELLRESGFAGSAMTVLDAMGGPDEARQDGVARDWTGTTGDLNTICIDCRADPGTRPLPRTGLPDSAFQHDGKMTKRELRMITLARLAPRRGALLWDIGAGCGSVGIEWMRAARDARAIGIEPDPARRAMAARNATRLGAPRLALIDGTAPQALSELPAPDAVFIGGGLDRETVAACLRALRPFGRLVANAVTLESETLLAEMQAEHGGDLTRIAVSRAEPVGRFRGWRPAMPVTQWSCEP